MYFNSPCFKQKTKSRSTFELLKDTADKRAFYDSLCVFYSNSDYTVNLKDLTYWNRNYAQVS